MGLLNRFLVSAMHNFAALRMKHLFNVYLIPIAAILASMGSCARQAAPTGGPKDTTPPGIDSVYSTPNYTTHFNRKHIELKFDEWITLTDASSQIIVSPPFVTKKVPDVKLKGRTVVIDIPAAEVLKPNTTYTINFGNSVKDLHEGNPAKDLRFVFSTGDVLDSLTVRGTVTDGFTGEPVDNVALMLYDNLSDTVVKKGRPYYYGRTDKSGQFTIRNIREGAFQAVAIDDTDQNLKWGGENESIGFVDSVLQIAPKSQPVLKIKLFKDFTTLKLLDKTVMRYGLVRLTYNGLPDTVKIQTSIPNLRFRTELVLDTLNIWYDQKETGAWQLIAGKDTVPVKNLSRDDFMKNHRMGMAGEAPPPTRKGKKALNPIASAPQPATPVPAAPVNIPTASQHPFKPAVLNFNWPVQSIDTSRWRFVLDSLPFHAFSVAADSSKSRAVQVSIAWKQGKTYTLTLLPGAVTDFFGTANADTIQRKFLVNFEKSLGGLNLTVSSLNPGSRYILELLNGGSEVEERRTFEAKTSTKRFVFQKLAASTYTVRLVEDKNGNGRWDTGSFSRHRQPELLFTKKLDPLRANWEVEATMDISTKPKEKK
jgi:hypothetical protein